MNSQRKKRKKIKQLEKQEQMRQSFVQSSLSLNSRNANILLLFKLERDSTTIRIDNTLCPSRCMRAPLLFVSLTTHGFPTDNTFAPRSSRQEKTDTIGAEHEGLQKCVNKFAKLRCHSLHRLIFDFQALRFATALQLTEVISVPPRSNEEICRNGTSKDETRKSNGSKSAYNVRESSSRENPAFSSKDEAA